MKARSANCGSVPKASRLENLSPGSKGYCPASPIQYWCRKQRPRCLEMTASDGLQVLLVAPTGRDAGLIEDALKSSGLQSEALKDVAHAAGIFHGREVGALLVAEEALGTAEIALLASALREQPSWSALPVLIL